MFKIELGFLYHELFLCVANSKYRTAIVVTKETKYVISTFLLTMSHDINTETYNK